MRKSNDKIGKFQPSVIPLVSASTTIPINENNL